MLVEDDRGMRNVQRRDRAFGGQLLHLAAGDLRCISQKFENHDGTVLRLRLPAPRELLLLLVDRALEPELLEVLLEGLVGLRIRQDLEVNHDVHVHRAGMRGHCRRTCRHQIAGREPADQVDRVLPGAQPTQQRDQDPFAVQRVLVAIPIQG